eukprot:7423917-Alexandrium_andersonii.AAC.1
MKGKCRRESSGIESANCFFQHPAAGLNSRTIPKDMVTVNRRLPAVWTAMVVVRLGASGQVNGPNGAVVEQP